MTVACKAYDNRIFFVISLLYTGVGFLPQKVQSAFCVKQDQTMEN